MREKKNLTKNVQIENKFSQKINSMTKREINTYKELKTKLKISKPNSKLCETFL